MKTYTFLEMTNQPVAKSLNEIDAIEFAKNETARKKAIDTTDKMPIYYPIVVDDESGLYTYLNEFIKKSPINTAVEYVNQVESKGNESDWDFNPLYKKCIALIKNNQS